VKAEASDLGAIVIPAIAPVPPGVTRTRWSVMIPTYNCAAFLRQTLESVLAQDPGPTLMQIEVVDDHSTKDDPEAVVAEVGRGRVGFFRHESNVGVQRNFNACIARARGELVHILHGDDFVEPRFYELVGDAADRHPDVALIATRTFTVDESGKRLWLDHEIPTLRSGSRDASPFYGCNPFRTPGMVVRRSFYEQFGGFALTLRHVTDWEMWVRAIANGGGVWLDTPLASYRSFAANDTSALSRTAENLRDFVRMVPYFERYPGFSRLDFLAMVARLALGQTQKFMQLRDLDASKANLQLLREVTSAVSDVSGTTDQSVLRGVNAA